MKIHLRGSACPFLESLRSRASHEGQTISQPHIVAFMVEAHGLKGGETVVEIGAGSGYAAAILAEIAGQVHTPWQFDEYIRFDETTAVTPLKTNEIEGMPETYPFRV